jgi:N-acetylmuramoyl-L-alanine amidase
MFSAIFSANAEVPFINVVYPKSGDTLGAVDSSFIFGSVNPGTKLKINGYPIDVHRDGGFLGFLPLKAGKFEFILEAVHIRDTSVNIWSVFVPQPMHSYKYDSLQMRVVEPLPSNKIFTNGDRFIFGIQATPGCKAWFSIPGYADSVPMVEIPPKIQPYWGETVFGAGAVPESLKVRGYYRGYLDIDHKEIPDSARAYYSIRIPKIDDIVQYLVDLPSAQIDYDVLSLLKSPGEIKTDSTQFYIRINPDDYPCMIEFTDSVQTVRVGPRKGYLSIFQPKGVKALAVGRDGDWIKLRLSFSQIGWVNVNSVSFLKCGLPPLTSYLDAVRIISEKDSTVIELPLLDKHPFRIEEIDARVISIYLYGVTSNTDWIRYDTKNTNLRLAAWEQAEPDLYKLRLHFNEPVWGYDAFYEGNTLKVVFFNPPEKRKKLKNKIIVIDPGHSPDPGAIGPTGLTEAEANLNMALVLERELIKKGARVILTRRDDSPVALYDRPQIALAHNADIFISLHNNALPDGVNPLENNGTSIYYYHPHSIDLARAVHDEILKATDLPSHGLYYGNLAVNRPTRYPAVLIESAFMMIPEQESLLKTEKFREKIAKAIRKGLERFLKEYGKN